MNLYLKQRWLPRLFWAVVTVAGISFALWILNFEGLFALTGPVEWLGAVGVIGVLIAYLINLGIDTNLGRVQCRNLAIYSMIVVGGFSWMLLNYRISEIHYFPDTWEYLAVARETLNSAEFFQAIRAPTLPIFIKLFGMSSFQAPSAEFLMSARLFTQFQSLFSLLASITLGLVLARRVTWRPIKPLALLAVMAFSLSTHISMWNKIVYAESISASFLFLLAAAFLTVDEIFSRKKSARRSLRFLGVLFFAAITLLFVLSRDSNAHLALMAALLISVAAAYEYRVRNEVSLDRFVTSVVLMAGFLLSTISAQGGRRWLRPNLNIIHQRIVPDDSALQFYVDHGLPYADHQQIFDLPWERFTAAVMNDYEARDILRWVQVSGLETYYRYLLDDPLQSLVAPFKHADHLLLPDSREYQLIANDPPDWIPIIDAIIYPVSAPVLIFMGSALLIGLVFYLRLRGWDQRFEFPIILLLTIYPLMFIVFHADELEIERHALGLAIQLRLSLILLSLFLLDAAVELYRSNFKILD